MSSPLAGFFIVAGSLLAWMLPVIVAVARKAPNIGSVIVVDVFLAWTVVGWVVALAMACRSRPEGRHEGSLREYR